MAEQKPVIDETSAAERAAQAVLKRKTPILVILAIVIIALAAYSVIRHNREKLDEEAANAVFDAGRKAMTAPADDITRIFAEVAEKYKGLPAAAQAVVIQFSEAVNKNDFAAAEAKADEFIRTYPAHPFVPRMTFAKGQALVNQGKYSAAIDIFRDLDSRNPAGLSPEVKLALAQAMWLEAEQSPGDEAAYKSRLESIRDSLVGIASSGQQNYLSAAMRVQTDFLLVLVNDRLAGYKFEPKQEPEQATDAQPTSEQPAAEQATAEQPATERVEHEVDTNFAVQVLPKPDADDKTSEAKAEDEAKAGTGKEATDDSAAPEQKAEPKEEVKADAPTDKADEDAGKAESANDDGKAEKTESGEK